MKRTATALVTAIAASVLTIPAASATANSPQSSHDSLRDRVNAVMETGGTVGALARSTGPYGKQRSATAGVSDKATGEAVRPGDRFRIASASKTFVATVVLQLAGEGRLSLDDTVEDWLPGVVSGNGNDGSQITVRQLLQHTSGLFNYTADFPLLTSVDGYEAGRYTTWTDEQLVAIAMKHQPDFAPGTKWSYSNTGYIVAGMIIEKATGHSWQQEVTHRIIKPLHLRHTSAPTTQTHIAGRHLHGYSDFDDSGATIDVTELNPSAGSAAGGMISTSADLTRFYQALLGGHLLRPAEMKAMKTTVRAPELDEVWPGASYGLGLLEIPLSCGGSYYGHGGDLPGYTTRDGVSADGRRVVVLATTGDGAADMSTEHARNKLIDGELCS
ncbi:serine hydrolase domain-containing protein [Streptomyces sp. DG2A-72]|uniref:serine hydrolase domain-containing protein n=1 Tax=Streptomyces sp. DG2A-72 TaxID=3051386 RepID=UPI00265BDFC3|nr:serine hydrolase domain-containing protein [Streptomyces sp. DG2A-72]MDO0934809.1 serine hydrolase domain-containing protein [Streptomyces sp. DG2A-72]